MPHCQTCRAPVRFAENAKTGKKLILDAVPDVERGNTSIQEDGRACVHGRDEAQRRRDRGDRLYVSHWATCPDRQGWREKRKTPAKPVDTGPPRRVATERYDI